MNVRTGDLRILRLSRPLVNISYGTYLDLTAMLGMSPRVMYNGGITLAGPKANIVVGAIEYQIHGLSHVRHHVYSMG